MRVGKGVNRLIHDTGGLRNDRALSEKEAAELSNYAKKLGMPAENIKVCGAEDTSPTGLFADTILYINNDALPARLPQRMGTRGANSRVTGKAAIAHEVIGHYESVQAGKAFEVYYFEAGIPKVNLKNFALDEAQASIRAAKFAPELSRSERFTLLRDGITRLRNANIRIRDVKDILYINKR